MKQLYFCKELDSETAYDLATLNRIANFLCMTQITVTKAIPDTDKNYFSCNFYQTVGEKSQSDCGRFCEEYTPKNGKSGMCRYQKKCYEPIGESITIKIKYHSNDHNRTCIHSPQDETSTNQCTAVLYSGMEESSGRLRTAGRRCLHGNHFRKSNNS